MDVKAWKQFIRQKERSIGGGYRAIDDRREFNEYVRSLRGGKSGNMYQIADYDESTKTVSNIQSFADVSARDKAKGGEGMGNKIHSDNGGEEWYTDAGDKVEVAVPAAAKSAAPAALFEGYYPYTVIKIDGYHYLITSIAADKKTATGVELASSEMQKTQNAQDFVIYNRLINGYSTNEYKIPEGIDGYEEGEEIQKVFDGKTYYLDSRSPSLQIGGQSIQGMSADQVRQMFANASSGRITNGDSPVFVTSPPYDPAMGTSAAEQPAMTVSASAKEAQLEKLQRQMGQTSAKKPAASAKEAQLEKLQRQMGQSGAKKPASKKPASSKKAAQLATIQKRMGRTTASAKKKSAGSPAMAKAKAARARVLTPEEEQLETLRRRMGQLSVEETPLEKIRRRQLGFKKIDEPEPVLLSELKQILLDRAKQEEEPHPFIIVLDEKQTSLQKVRLTRQVDYEFKRGVKKSGYKASGNLRGKYMQFATVCSDAREKGKNSFMVKSASGEIRHYIVVGNKCVRQLHDGIHLKFSSKSNYMKVVSKIVEFNKINKEDKEHKITEFERVNKKGDNVRYVLKNGRFQKK